MIHTLRFSDQGHPFVIWTDLRPGVGRAHTAFIEPAQAMFELSQVGLEDDFQYWCASLSHETIHVIVAFKFRMFEASEQIDSLLTRALNKIRRTLPRDHARGFYFSDEEGMFARVLEEVCLSA